MLVLLVKPGWSYLWNCYLGKFKKKLVGSKNISLLQYICCGSFESITSILYCFKLLSLCYFLKKKFRSYNRVKHNTWAASTDVSIHLGFYISGGVESTILVLQCAVFETGFYTIMLPHYLPTPTLITQNLILKYLNYTFWLSDAD